jgi:hypothetical protein
MAAGSSKRYATDIMAKNQELLDWVRWRFGDKGDKGGKIERSRFYVWLMSAQKSCDCAVK